MSLDFLVPYEVRVNAKPFVVLFDWVTSPRSGGSIEVPPEPIGIEDMCLAYERQRCEDMDAAILWQIGRPMPAIPPDVKRDIETLRQCKDNFDALQMCAPYIPGMWLVFRHGRLVAGATSMEEAWGLGYPREGTLIAFSCYPRPGLMETEKVREDER